MRVLTGKVSAFFADGEAREEVSKLGRDSAQVRIQDWAAVCRDGSLENLER